MKQLQFLVGDALQSIAFEILSDLKTHKDGNVRSKLVNELAKCAGYSGMVEGQMQDLEAEKKLKIDEIKKLQDLKLENFSTFLVQQRLFSLNRRISITVNSKNFLKT